MNLINVTQARSNLSKIVSDVFKNRKKYVLIRDSIPQAVILPFDDYKDKEDEWRDEVRGMMKTGRKQFNKYLKNQKKKWPKNEKQVYEIVDQVAGRS